MDTPDTGPVWIWKFGCYMAITGIMAVIALIGFGIYWLITHITIN